MIFKYRHRLVLFTIIVLNFFAFQNCGTPYQVTPTQSNHFSEAGPGTPPESGNIPTPGTNPDPTPSPTPTPCTPQTTLGKLRLMFIVDASSSTFNTSMWTGTDPDSAIRTKSVYNFVSANASMTNLTYSYAYFSNQGDFYDFSKSDFIHVAATATGTPPSPVVPVQPFGSSTQEMVAANRFNELATSLRPDGNGGFLFNTNMFSTIGTNYELAFKIVQAAITRDIAINKDESYVVIFMSDGQPNTGGKDYIKYVQNIVTAAGGPTRATVSGVYFGPENDPTSISNISNIAKAGGGAFVDSNTTSLTLDNMIQGLIQVPTGACKPQ